LRRKGIIVNWGCGAQAGRQAGKLGCPLAALQSFLS